MVAMRCKFWRRSSTGGIGRHGTNHETSFIFGGENRINNRKKYKDAYILSLPGFVWTKLPDAPAGGRAYHQCVAVGRRQVLSIGGVETVNKDRDKAPQGLLVYDMTAMKWNDFYDANLPAYEAPDTVKRWYKQNSLDKVQWSSDEVKQLFVKRTEGSGNSGGFLAADFRQLPSFADIDQGNCPLVRRNQLALPWRLLLVAFWVV